MMNIEVHLLDGIGKALAGAVLYVILLRRCADIAQPYRLRMAVLGEAMLASGPSAQRAGQIQFYLENAFSGWVMVFAAIVVPFAAIWGVVKQLSGRFRLTPESNKEDERLMRLFTGSAYAANPLFGTIVAMEVLVIAASLLLVFGPPAFMAAVEELIRVEMALLGRRQSAHCAPALV